MPESQFRVWYLFLAQVIAIAGILQWNGKFEPTPQFDTASYRDYAMDSVEAALNDKRTFVYPCVLRFFQTVDGSDRLIPWFQFTCSAAAIGFLMAVLLACKWNCWMALAAVSPILASQMVLDYSGLLTPDLLAQSLAIGVVSLWIFAVHSGRNACAYAGLALAVFLTYQTKPSYLFLLAFVPIGGFIARAWLMPTHRDAWLVAFRLSLASIIPFLAWCTFRWAWVGHFGLVSFGGYNIVGIAGQLLERDTLPFLSADVQPLAEEILKRRDGLKDWPLQRDYESMETQFNRSVWEIAVPVASSLYGDDSRLMNYQMAKLSSEILLQDPKAYLRWLAWSTKRAIRTSVEITLRNPIVMLSIPLMLCAFAIRWRRKSLGVELARSIDFAYEFQWIVWTAIGFAVCKLGLVILVEPPIDRYCAPATIFLPSILVMIACTMVFATHSVADSLSERHRPS
jgi:hypothetical protein